MYDPKRDWAVWDAIPSLLHVISVVHCYSVLILTKLRKHPLCSYGRTLYLLISTNYLVFILQNVCTVPRQTSYFKFAQGFDNILSTLLPSLKILQPTEEMKQVSFKQTNKCMRKVKLSWS